MKNQTPEIRYQISLRVNRDLLDEIRRAAAREERPINTYLIRMLRQQMKSGPTKDPK